MPDRARVDALMRSVARSFFVQRPVEDGERSRVRAPSSNDPHLRTLDAALSVVRKPRCWDSWTPLEVAVFEAVLCRHGKDFAFAARLLPNKTVSDVVKFYYTSWKTSDHGRRWRRAMEAGGAL
jgi:hypothetical protein